MKKKEHTAKNMWLLLYSSTKCWLLPIVIKKKRIEIHTYVVEFSNTHPHIYWLQQLAYSAIINIFFAKLNKTAIYFLKFNPLWSYVSFIAHAICPNDGFFLQPNKDRCLFQDFFKNGLIKPFFNFKDSRMITLLWIRKEVKLQN